MQSNYEKLENRVHELVGKDLNRLICSDDVDAILDKAYIRTDWEDLIQDQNPKLFLTITFIAPPLRVKRTKNESTVSETEAPAVLTDFQAFRVMNELIKRVNQRLFGNDRGDRNHAGRNRENYLRGIGCMEHQKCGQPHFHFLINSEITSFKVQETIEAILADSRKKYKKRINEARLRKNNIIILAKKAELELERTGCISPVLEKKYSELSNEIRKSKGYKNPINHFSCVDGANLKVDRIYSSDGLAKYCSKVLENSKTGCMVILDADGVHDYNYSA